MTAAEAVDRLGAELNDGTEEVRQMHPATTAILRYFAYDHLPPHLQAASMPFHQLAHTVARDLDGPELTAGLRKLLEAKDCMVRAALDKES